MEPARQLRFPRWEPNHMSQRLLSRVCIDKKLESGASQSQTSRQALWYRSQAFSLTSSLLGQTPALIYFRSLWELWWSRTQSKSEQIGSIKRERILKGPGKKWQWNRPGCLDGVGEAEPEAWLGNGVERTRRCIWFGKWGTRRNQDLTSGVGGVLSWETNNSGSDHLALI